MSRTTTAHLFSSIDHVVQDPHLWQFDAFGAEEGAAMDRSLTGVTDVVIGAELWRQWSQYWPTAQDEFGAFINPVRKHVLSTSLADGTTDGDLGWNSTLLTGDPVAAVRALREQDGPGRIAVVGGIATVRSLFLAGEIDELTLTVHPVIAGSGERLFGPEAPTTRLVLLGSEITPAGNAMLTYGLRPADAG